MKQKILDGDIRITRPTCGGLDEDEQYISITVEDKLSLTEFLEIRVTYADFTKALTGQGGIKCQILPYKMETVGKQKEMKELIFEVRNPLKTSSKEWAKANCQLFADVGWTASNYFNSQNSTFMKDGKEYARTHQYRYVEVSDSAIVVAKIVKDFQAALSRCDNYRYDCRKLSEVEIEMLQTELKKLGYPADRFDEIVQVQL